LHTACPSRGLVRGLPHGSSPEAQAARDRRPGGGRGRGLAAAHGERRAWSRARVPRGPFLVEPYVQLGDAPRPAATAAAEHICTPSRVTPAFETLTNMSRSKNRSICYSTSVSCSSDHHLDNALYDAQSMSTKYPPSSTSSSSLCLPFPVLPCTRCRNSTCREGTRRPTSRSGWPS